MPDQAVADAPLEVAQEVLPISVGIGGDRCVTVLQPLLDENGQLPVALSRVFPRIGEPCSRSQAAMIVHFFWGPSRAGVPEPGQPTSRVRMRPGGIPLPKDLLLEEGIELLWLQLGLEAHEDTGRLRRKKGESADAVVVRVREKVMARWGGAEAPPDPETILVRALDEPTSPRLTVGGDGRLSIPAERRAAVEWTFDRVAEWFDGQEIAAGDSSAPGFKFEFEDDTGVEARERMLERRRGTTWLHDSFQFGVKLKRDIERATTRQFGDEAAVIIELARLLGTVEWAATWRQAMVVLLNELREQGRYEDEGAARLHQLLFVNNRVYENGFIFYPLAYDPLLRVLVQCYLTPAERERWFAHVYEGGQGIPESARQEWCAWLHFEAERGKLTRERDRGRAGSGGSDLDKCPAFLIGLFALETEVEDERASRARLGRPVPPPFDPEQSLLAWLTKRQHRALRAFRDVDFDAVRAAEILGLKQSTSLNQMIGRIGERVSKGTKRARADFHMLLDNLDEEAAQVKRARRARDD